MTPLRVAVVGAGIMGSNHVRVIKRLPDISLIAVVDTDLERAAIAAGDPSVMTCRTIDDLPEIDAAIVAVPTEAHLAAALMLIGRGVHLLVEKPLANTVEECEQIVAAASKADVVLAVGHVERFNPAIAELASSVADPIHITTVRVGPYSPRVSDGVVMDLMIHDIDILCSFARPGDRVNSVSGAGRVVKGATEDLAVVSMAFESGMTASLTASRLGQQKIRTVEVTQPEVVTFADLVRSDVTIHRMAHHEFLGDSGVSYRQTNVVEIPFIVNRGEPLGLELTDFFNAIRSGSSPRVRGEDGSRAVRIARDVLDHLYIADRPIS